MRKTLQLISPLLFALYFIPSIANSQEENSRDKEFHLDEVYDIDSNGKIDLNSNDAKVYILGSNRNNVHVKIDRVVETIGWIWGDKGFDVIVESRNGNLYISDKEWGNWGIAGYVREEYVIKIEAPHSVALSIRGDDDDYSISAINGDIRMELDDGDVDLDNCLGSSYYFDIDDGDISMKGGSGELTVKLDDGDIEIYDARFTSVEAYLDDGDMGIETSVVNNGYYRFEIDDGSLDLIILDGGGKFDIRHDDVHVRYDKSFNLEEEDENYTVLTLPGGDARIRISGDDMSIRLSSNKVN